MANKTDNRLATWRAGSLGYNLCEMTKNYEHKVIDFQIAKDQGIREENSWLALAGLTWLEPGKNTVGSDSSCDILLPARAPALLGVFEFDGATISFRAADGQSVKINGKSVTEAVLKSSKDETPSFITLNNLRMVVHEHNGGYGVRMWDNDRTERRTQPPRKWFPINKNYRFRADFTRFETPVKAMLPNIFGDAEEWDLTGRVSFTLGGKNFTLDTTDSKDNTLFIQFKDLTSKTSTYPSGRYLYTEPIEDGKVIVDFNFSYNPPCVFTPYATCAFAPKQNELPIMIEAGEVYEAKKD